MSGRRAIVVPEHPAGLYVLFFTEMWERFGFYLLVALLALYLTEHLHASEARAGMVLGTYQGLAYLTPVFGGLLADRLVGYRGAVLAGAVCLGAGYFLLAVPSITALYCALGLLVLGCGLFKPNVSTLVGNLYPLGDPRRDSAYSIFYMGINIGGGLGPLVGGFVRHHYGWGPAFAAAGVGMLLSIGIFFAFRRDLARAERGAPDEPGPAELAELAELAEQPPRDLPAVEKQRLTALAVMGVVLVLFWLAFYQQSTALTFWARDNTDRVLRLGSHRWEIAPEYFAAVNSAFIITLTPVLLGVMALLRRRNLEPSTPAKIGLGMGLTGAAFLLMAIASWSGGNTGRVSMLWLVGYNFLITIGELLVSPLGLSLVATMAPPRMRSLVMGLWFCSTAIGASAAGYLGVFWARWPHSRFFMLLVLTSLFAIAILASQSRRLRAAMPAEESP